MPHEKKKTSGKPAVIEPLARRALQFQPSGGATYSSATEEDQKGKEASPVTALAGWAHWAWCIMGGHGRPPHKESPGVFVLRSLRFVKKPFSQRVSVVLWQRCPCLALPTHMHGDWAIRHVCTSACAPPAHAAEQNEDPHGPVFLLRVPCAPEEESGA